ncbi:MAG: dihydroneopterin aldolase [Ignavibacteriaceae bacterium]|nr:dihydroneopterin aldolase [Ignavibacteriaceae bacterium]
MLNIIRIKKAVFYGYHGVLSQEQSVGGRFEADVDMYTDFTAAAKEDSLTRTINYENVYKCINQLALEKKYHLIETLAVLIADELLDRFGNIQKLSVRVIKQNPPLGGVVDCVEVEVIKTRDEREREKHNIELASAEVKL